MKTNPTQIQHIIDTLDFYQHLSFLIAFFKQDGLSNLNDADFDMFTSISVEHAKCFNQLQHLVPKQWLLMEINEPTNAQFMQIQQFAHTSSLPSNKLANIGLSKKLVIDKSIYN